MIMISFEIDTQKKQLIDSEAKSLGVTRSRLLRSIVAKYLMIKDCENVD